MNPTTTALHEWAVKVSYLLTTADHGEEANRMLDKLIRIEIEHGLVDDDGEVTY